METRVREVKARKYPEIGIKIMPGHFATRHSHINYYVDVTELKSYQRMASLAGEALASQFPIETQVDTIVCVDGAEVIAAFLAKALASREGRPSDIDIAVVTPERNSSGQMIFRDNTQRMIWNRNVLLLVASATTGNTLSQAIESIQYYSGRVSGIGALFSAIDRVKDVDVMSVFTTEDVPGYRTFSPGDCPECRANRKIDALVNDYGYSRI